MGMYDKIGIYNKRTDKSDHRTKENDNVDTNRH